ncbi:PRD domain-containing protein [Liquorilactobacillus satsumensis]|uniref:BglG family transcription antiterminator LicT n=1 Tax=Liquorilactobacillus satsumensis TaxID=259059 RepID=UPI0021C46CBF|nr:PRD domain-containing protein [Liquorilactobacillus satsumensis]MCP9312404.1 PRD domain-containing protein [Liquorilactobacillus satsumensis]MCP9359592.1 PRD domain-containing protein [Liquorilactobacillus satsumensis]
MKIKQIFNNNVLLAAEKKQEVVLLGRGIGFQKKRGMEVDQSKIEQVFAPTDDKWFSLFHDLLSDVSPAYLELAAKIVQMASDELNTKFNDYLLISLMDHISFAVTRYQNKQKIRNEILWEIKNYYPAEYQTGEKALELINEKFAVDLPSDEAGFIAMKFVENSWEHPESNGTAKMTALIGDILQIVQYQLKITFKLESISYRRFLVHLRFLTERMLQHRVKTIEEGDRFLLEHLVRKYPTSYECTKKVALFIKTKMKIELSLNEQIYLTMHIQRIIDELNQQAE